MADVTRTYHTVYTTDASSTDGALDTTTGKLVAQEKVVDRLQKKWGKFGDKFDARAKEMVKTCDLLATALGKVETKANAAAAAMQAAAKAGVAVDKATIKAATSAAAAAANYTAMASQADAAATGVTRAGAAANFAATATTDASKAAGKAATNFGTTATNAGKTATSLDAATVAANAAATALAALIANSKTLNVNIKNTTKGTDGFGASLMRIVTGGMAMRAVAHAIDALGEGLKKARDFADETAKYLLKTKDALRELAALRGETHVGTKLVGDQLALSTATGATDEETNKFDQVWESSIGAMKASGHWKMSDDDTKKMKKETLAMAVRMGMNPDKLAENLGGMGVAEDIGSAEEGLGMLAIQAQLAQLGIGHFDQFFKAFQKRRGGLVDPKGGQAFKTSQEMAAVSSVASYTAGSPIDAETAINAAWRDMNKQSPEMEATNRRLGITQGMGYVERTRRLKKIVDAGEAPGGGGARKALLNAGFKNDKALVRIMSDVHDIDKIERAEKIAHMGTAGGGAAVVAANEQFKQEQPERFVEARVRQSEAARGQMREKLTIQRQAARARLISSGWTEGTTVDEILGSVVEGIPGGKGLIQGIEGESRTEQTYDQEIRARLLAVDPDAEKKYPGLHNAVGDDLAAIINQLPVETLAKMAADPKGEAAVKAMQATPNSALPPAVKAANAALDAAMAPVPAARGPGAAGAPPPGAGPGAVGVAPPAPAGGVGGGIASGDSAAVNVLTQILAVVRQDGRRGALPPRDMDIHGYRSGDGDYMS